MKIANHEKIILTKRLEYKTHTFENAFSIGTTFFTIPKNTETYWIVYL